MNKPNFVTDNYNVTIEHPSDYKSSPVVVKNSAESLNGTLREDTLYRKYNYTLSYDAMSYTDYESLLELLEDAVDNNLSITFTWPKWTHTASGVLVKIDLPERNRAGGSGSTGYYSKVDLVLREVNSR